MAEKLQLRLHKFAFGKLRIQLVLAQQFQHNFQVQHVLSLNFAVDDNIIQVDQYKLANDIFEHVIHDVLKRTWCIGETKAQYLELKQPEGSGESCLGNVLRLQPDLIVCTLQINAADDRCTLQLIKQLINAWQWIAVLDGLIIETAMVNTHAQVTSLLLDKQHR